MLLFLSKLPKALPVRHVFRHRFSSSRSTNAGSSKPSDSEIGSDTSSSQTMAFHDLVEKGEIDAVKSALQTSHIPNLVNQGDPGRAQTTPLHLASRRGFVNVASYLVEQGADVNVQGAWELTPLHYSAIFNQPEITKLLLQCNADTSLKDVKGCSALDHAMTEQNIDVATILQKWRG